MAKIIIVPHTHWDREWYLPFEGYRYLLVRLVDELLKILRKDEEYAHFLLDGQTIIAEDYLEIRPENEERFREEVAKGRIGIGPWYTMPDEFLAGGEAIVRNLLLGHRLGRRLGGVMEIGYLPLYRERREPVHYTLVAKALGVNKFSAYDMLKVLERKGVVASEYILSKGSGPGRSTITFYATNKAAELLTPLAEM